MASSARQGPWARLLVASVVGAGVGGACSRLSGPTDPHEKACRAGDGEECNTFGNTLLARCGDPCVDLDAGALTESFYRRGCELKNQTACHNVIWALANGVGQPADLPRALSRYEERCSEGYATTCRGAAHLWQTGRGIEKDLKKASRLYRRSCQLGDGEGCCGAGQMARSSDAMGAHTRAFKLFRRGCELRDGCSCTELGVAYELGRGVEIEFDQALHFAEQACELDEPTGCHHAGLLWANHFEDPARSLPFFAKACRADSFSGCAQWWLFAHDEGDDDEAQLALNALQTACGRSQRACVELAHVYAKQGDPERALATHLDACDAGIDEGCFQAAFMWIDESKGKVTRAHAPKAYALLEGPCERGLLGACYNRVWLLSEGALGRVDAGVLQASYLELCERGSAKACASAAYRAETGLDGRMNQTLAQELYERACTRGDGTGCNNLGFMYETGAGVPSDAERANTLYSKACSLGEDFGCGALGQLQWRGATDDDAAAEAVELLERGCRSEDQSSCHVLAQALDDGFGIERDHARAKRLRASACTKGHRASCSAKRKH